MSDHVPVADKVESEITAFSRLWRKRPWVAALLAVVLIAVVGWSIHSNISLAGKLEAMRVERDAVATQFRESERENRGLREIVAPLLARAAREFPGEEINESLKKVVTRLEASLPQNQLIASASVTAEIFCVSDENLSNHYIDNGCFVGFGKGSEAILTAYSGDSFGQKIGEGTVRYRTVAQMASDDASVGRKVMTLTEAQYIQIEFGVMPERMNIKGGKIVVVLNGFLRLEFAIPSQVADGRKIFIHDVGPAIAAAIAGKK